MSLPPGPSFRYLGFDQISLLRKDMLGWYSSLKKEYGDIVCVRMGPLKYITVFHPDLVEEVLVKQAKNFPKSPPVRRVLSQWNGDGLILSEGELWKKQRRLIQQGFQTTQFHQYAEIMSTYIDEFIQKLSSGDGIDIEEHVTDLTLKIVCHCLFGQLPEETKEIGRAVQVLSEIAVEELESPFVVPLWIPTRRNKEKRWAMEFIDRVVWGFIKQKRDQKPSGDLLSLLLTAVDDEGDKAKMSEKQAHDECIGLFLAGHDTTASGLMWTFYNLARFPQFAKKLQEEANEVFHRSKGYPATKELRHTENFINETLRLFPPAIGVFQRVAQTETKLGGYTIPKGAILQPISYVTHRDHRFFEAPEEFNPDRFSRKPSPYEFYPFGAGPRACIGRAFAMLEMLLTTAQTVARFDVQLCDPALEPGLKPIFSLRSQKRIILRFTPYQYHR